MFYSNVMTLKSMIHFGQFRGKN